MRNNIQAMLHPTIQRKIRYAIWFARLAARRNEMNGHGDRSRGVQYVQNRYGHNIMRIDFYRNSGLVVWGDNSKNITSMVEASMYKTKRGI